MPDITFFHKTHLDDHFPVVDLYNEEHKVRWTQSLFLNENDQNVLMSLPFSFNRRKIDKGLRGKALGWVLALTFPFWKPFEVTDERKKETELFFAPRCLGCSSLFDPLFWISFLLKHRPRSSHNALIKARGQRERDVSVCRRSYQ